MATHIVLMKMTGFYFTLGDYDYIAIAEGLADEAGASFLLKLDY